VRVTRLDHVNIHTAQFDESLRFYTEVIGLVSGPIPGALATPAGEAPRGAWLYDAEQRPMLHLIRSAAHTPDASIPARLDHFAIACEDLEGYAERFTQNAVPFERVSYPQFGIFQLVVHDSNGIKIELGFSRAIVEAP
jgi:catechol 2,3-dioxygenase-like lactoylglutathione lyase family enzyme